MIRSLRSLRRAARRDDGASTLEFVLIVPVLFGFIVNSCEAGLVMTRGAFLDWGLNSAVRELRLGAITESSEFVDAVCSHVWVLGEEGECKRRLQLEVVVFDRAGGLQKGDYAEVVITGSTSATLFGDVTRRATLGAANAASGEAIAA